MIAAVCRVCGCTEQKPCFLEEIGSSGDFFCQWMDERRTLCSNPACVAVIPLDELLELVFPQPRVQAAAAGR